MVAVDVASSLVGVGIAVCWGLVVVVWAAGALYIGAYAPRVRMRGTRASTALIGAIAGCAVLVFLSRRYGHDLAVGSSWLRVARLAVLAASTTFTL